VERDTQAVKIGEIAGREDKIARQAGGGDQVPTGTYLDMTANLPVVDPREVQAPVMIVRGEHDGIASEEDLLDFFRQLPNPDRQFVVLPGAAHALVFGHNRHQLWHTVHSFLTMPPRRDRH